MSTQRILAALLASGLVLASTSASADLGGGVYGTLRLQDSPFVVLSDITVPSGTTLEIEPGCSLLFMPGAGLRVDGTLEATGSARNPITFAPHPSYNGIGQWEGLMLAGAGPHVLSEVIVSRAATGLRVRTGVSCDVRHAMISESLGDGMVFDAGAQGAVTYSGFAGNGGSGILVQDASPTISQSSFSRNARALTLVGNSFPDLSRLTATGHGDYDGAVIDTSRPITQAGYWRGCGLPYVVQPAEQLRVDTPGLLVLDTGAVVKLGRSASIMVDGTLMTLGTEGAPCVFTALTDDSYFGDTPGDGPTQPGKGDWSGIDVGPGGLARLNGAALRHGDDGVRVVMGGSAALVGCEVGPTLFRGLAFGMGSSGYVALCTLHDNDIGLYTAEKNVIAGPTGQDPTAGGNMFTCNVSKDAVNESSEPLLLGGNYWGGSAPDPANFSGLIDFSSWIVDDYDTASERTLRVRREGTAELYFWWRETSSCATHRVVGSALPNGQFVALASPTYDEYHLEQGGVYHGASVMYFKLRKGF